MTTALVTGASRGIGRATVEGLLDRGWRVVAGVRDVDATRAALGDREGLHVVAMDVTDLEQVHAGVAAAEDLAGGALHALVPNAGYAVVGAVEDVAIDEARAVMETNTFGALSVVQAAAPGMRRAGRGAIVFVSTVGAGLPTPLLGAYRASKAALNAFADVLAMEMRPFGVRVSRVEPGMVATEFSRSTVRSGAVAAGEGPYADLFAALRDGMGAWRARYDIGADVVAAEIVRLIDDPAPPSAVAVGDDSRLLATLDEDGLLDFLGIEWPRRPATP
jgi:NAD(P)-dependent dehydrogenase (short-subunit alcohol dehydrogenase family)